MSPAEKHYGTHPSFKTTLRHRRLGYLLHFNRRRPPGLRPGPDVVHIDPQPGAQPNDAAPVRIFVGTEPAQHRAFRIFVWSVLQVRDPSRRYEIHVMKDLAGFDRTGWKTGFTYYRYAIPQLAGGKGRAIYNDVDQIYLKDPAILFDMDMQGRGVCGINERETSVLLIDCEKMNATWRREEAETSGFKHKHFRRCMLDSGQWGAMPGIWNARDWEYEPGESGLLHYTTLQTQPWRPFPNELRYHESPEGKIWFALEKAADATGFTVFTEDRSSARYGELLAVYRQMHEIGTENRGHGPEKTFYGKSLADHIAPISRLVRETAARTILDFGSGKGKLYDPLPGEPAESRFKQMKSWGDVRVTCYDPGYEPFAGPYAPSHDGVISTDVLEHIPDDDIPWVLDKLFRQAASFVYVVAATYPARKLLPNGENAHCTLQGAGWWREQMEGAARRNPGVRWQLCVQRSRHLRATDRMFAG